MLLTTLGFFQSAFFSPKSAAPRFRLFYNIIEHKRRFNDKA
uniref:Uncharacterized protein n=1 Tax=Rhizophora mucronata TaxID=61149 RepID=A0A2P2NJ90_RHIMU